jgi:hypothetical protein
MKRRLIPLLTVIALTGGFILFSGCSDDDNITQTDVNNLYGTWVQASVTINGVAANLADVLEWDEETVEGQIAFYNTYTYTAVELDASDSPVYTENGTFEIDDNWLILTTTTVDDSTVTPSQAYNGTWATDGTTLTLTQTAGTDTMVLTLSRPD